MGCKDYNRPMSSSNKRLEQEKAIALVWLLGGALLAFLFASLIMLTGLLGWIATPLFLMSHTLLLKLRLGGLTGKGNLQILLMYLTADLLWIVLLLGPWIACAGVCLVISLGVVFAMLRRFSISAKQ